MASKPVKKIAAKKGAKKAKPAKKAPKAKAAKPVKKAPAKKAIAPAKGKSVVKAVLGKVAAVLKPTKTTEKPAPEVKAKKTGKADAAPVTKISVNGAEEVAAPVDEEIVLTDAEGRRYCRTADCDQLSLVDGYCRYHYLLFWKRIQNRKKILAGGKLERYIEELTARYADKFLEMLRKDLRSEKDFMLAIQELELDDDAASSEESEEEETKTYLEEIRGISSDDATTTDDDY